MVLGSGPSSRGRRTRGHSSAMAMYLFPGKVAPYAAAILVNLAVALAFHPLKPSKEEQLHFALAQI